MHSATFVADLFNHVALCSIFTPSAMGKIFENKTGCPRDSKPANAQ